MDILVSRDILVNHILPYLYSDLASICRLQQVCKDVQKIIWDHLHTVDFSSVSNIIKYDEAIRILQKAKNMKHLDLSRCSSLLPPSTTENIFPHCSSTLESLDVSHLHFRVAWISKESEGIPPECIFPNLRSLNLSNSGRFISDVTIHFLPSTLKHLNLENCTRLSSIGNHIPINFSLSGLTTISKRCQKLETVQLKGVYR